MITFVCITDCKYGIRNYTVGQEFETHEEVLSVLKHDAILSSCFIVKPLETVETVIVETETQKIPDEDKSTETLETEVVEHIEPKKRGNPNWRKKI